MRDWIVEESGFQKEYLRKYESIMCMGNGYMGVRAATEEDYERAVRYTLVAGTFDAKEDENTTELPNAADTTALFVTANGIPLQLTQDNTENYSRSLSLMNGLVTRSFIWCPCSGVRLKFRSERFVSLKELHVLGYRVSIKVLEGCGTLELQSGIIGGERYGSPHFTAMQGQQQDGIMQYAETTHESDITFVTSAVVNAWTKDKDGKNCPIEMTITTEEERVMSSCNVSFEEGQEFYFEKLCRIATTRDKELELLDGNVSKYGRDLLLHREKEEMVKLQKRGYEETWNLSQKCWKKLWKQRDIVISGSHEKTAYDQLAVRFAIYHLTIMAPLHDNRMNIGAKGLSGKGYYGHTFWDTEIYMLPYYVWENPEGARSLLEYRYLCMDSARKNALESGFEGAKYPWEAAWITDGDSCPKKHFTQYELHVTADVAYGVYYYYEITHDMDFMRKYGCEILFETAQFWKSRLEYNVEKDVYEICNVIGPDEFTHEANNNAYTNYLAHLNLKLAIEWKERLQKDYPEDYARLNEKLNLEGRMEGWIEGRDKLVLPVPNEDNILPQDDDYMTLPEIDLSIYRRKEKKLRVDYPYPTYTRLKVSKQADVMNLFLLQEELFTDEVKRASLAYYEPFCVHESSLSLCAYSMLAADCGENERAYELFLGARDIDLSLKNDSDHGIHAASLGGIWQCCVLGFAGVRMCGGKLRIRPNLPEHWNEIQFRMWWRGSQLEVAVTKDDVAYKVLQGPHLADFEEMINCD